jgi:alkanesulfonate monooxygenase SsuD/methylene tetrahydromethanopterin reductase-like flavin-dependent oxidoreductase (luciferase family)
MDVGIGIPNSIYGTTGKTLLEWARRSEAAGFSSLASIGAVSYPSHEELTVFAAAGAVTERIRFLSNVLIAPARSTAELAKQAATVDQLTDGRLGLGLGVGWRKSDFDLTGRAFGGRGAAFDQQIKDLHRAWSGEPIAADTRPVSPRPVQSPIPIYVGGANDATIRRVVELDVQGWTAGGMPPDAVAGFASRVRDAWRDAGREGSPRIVGLVYFGLGDSEQGLPGYLLDYYAPMGTEVAEMIAGSALRSAEAVKGALHAYEEAGVDELILDPTLSDPDQVDLLAAAAFS